MGKSGHVWAHLGIIINFVLDLTYVRPFSAAQRPFSATMGKVMSYFGDKNGMVSVKMQLEIKIHSFIRFIGKPVHLQGNLLKKCYGGTFPKKKNDFQIL